MIEQQLCEPSIHADEVDFLLTNPDSSRVMPMEMAEAAINFGLYPDSPILTALGGTDMKWQRMQHRETKAEIFMAAPVKAEFNLHEALITMAIPHDRKRLPGNRIAGVIDHGNGIRQVIGLDYDQHHRGLNRIGFSDPRPDFDAPSHYSFSRQPDTFKPTEAGASYLTAGIFTDAMLTAADAHNHLNGEVIDHSYRGNIGKSLTSSELAHYDMLEQEGFIILRNSVWQLPPVIPPKLDQ